MFPPTVKVRYPPAASAVADVLVFGPPHGEPFGFLTNCVVVLKVSHCVMTLAELTAAERLSSATMLKLFFIPTPPERSPKFVSNLLLCTAWEANRDNCRQRSNICQRYLGPCASKQILHFDRSTYLSVLLIVPVLAHLTIWSNKMKKIQLAKNISWLRSHFPYSSRRSVYPRRGSPAYPQGTYLPAP